MMRAEASASDRVSDVMATPIDPNTIKGVVSAEKSEVVNLVTQPNPETGGWRLSFEFAVKGQTSIELRAVLVQNDAPLSEVWIYRWTA